MQEGSLSESEIDDLLQKMTEQIAVYRFRDFRVLDVMRRVKRHLFVPSPDLSDLAVYYQDRPVPIGYGQTISQPFIVAYMVSLVNPEPGMKILEIGAGSGYLTAILSELGADVYAVEIVPELAVHAGRVLRAAGYDSARVLEGDGYKGWPEHAPYDAVIGACAPEHIPQPLVDQLKDGGRIIMPVGESEQKIFVLTKKEGTVLVKKDISVRFVPMVRK